MADHIITLCYRKISDAEVLTHLVQLHPFLTIYSLQTAG